MGFCWFLERYKQIAVRLISKAKAASFIELYLISIFFFKSVTKILWDGLPAPIALAFPNKGWFFPCIAALILARVSSECVFPRRDAAILARDSSECLLPNHEPAWGKILYSGSSKSI